MLLRMSIFFKDTSCLLTLHGKCETYLTVQQRIHVFDAGHMENFKAAIGC
jgi:hypothetical protein